MTIFEQEIRAQGTLLAGRTLEGAASAASVAHAWADIEYAFVAARGSSDNAAVFFQYLAGQELGLAVALAAPSLFDAGRSVALRGAGVLAISQSGRTPGLANVLESARRQARPSVAVTNDRQSPLAQAGDYVIDLAAGDERAIASTKTFSSSWHALGQLVSALKGSALPGLAELPGLVDQTVGWALAADLPVADLDVEGGITVVGRGIGKAVASEIALKIREVTGIRAEGFAAPDYLHGPIGASRVGATLVIVLTDEVTNDVASELVQESRAFGMRIVVVRASGRPSVDGDAEIVVPGTMPNWCLGLAHVVVGQVLALRIGERRGRPIDTAPGLRKVTTTA